MFASQFLAGFECSTHRRRDGRRLDLIAGTGHDAHAHADYQLLLSHGIACVRDGLRWHLIEAAPGRYDWASFAPMLQAARSTGMQVIWDLLHYGWPEGLDPWSPDFVPRFADFAAAAATLIGPSGNYVAINEISFLSWAGGEVGYMNPFKTGCGNGLKAQLCKASIAASRAIRAVDPRATIMAVEPLINVIAGDATQDSEREAANACSAQFDVVEILLGRRMPELGGRDDTVDVAGLNYYPYNQFTHDRRTVALRDARYVPLRQLLHDAGARIRKPLLVAETGCEDEGRPDWLEYVAGEVRAANRFGADVQGVCLYPILNHLGWDDNRYCANGMFCGLDPNRSPYAPLAAMLARQQQAQRQAVHRDQL